MDRLWKRRRPIADLAKTFKCTSYIDPAGVAKKLEKRPFQVA